MMKDDEKLNDAARRERPPQDQRYVPDHPTSAVGQIKWGKAPWGNGIGRPDWEEAGDAPDRFVQRNYNPLAGLDD